MSAMISIDFGNSFTKVGIRLDHNSESQLAKDGSLEQDDGLNICIPSLVANVSKGTTQKWYYGTDVLQFASGTPNMKVYRNWKPSFFRGVEQRPIHTPTDAALAVVGAGRAGGQGVSASEVQDFSKKSGIPLDQLEALLRNQQSKMAPERQLDAPEPWINSEGGEDDLREELLEHVGIGFFTWLREFIAPLCRRKGIDDVGGTPVRISLPSFGSHTKAEDLLVDILERSGWKPDERIPAIAEPISNSIGIFTEGRNATFSNKQTRWQECPSNGRMFGFYEPGLFQALRNRVLEQGQKFYWAMGVDLEAVCKLTTPVL